MDNDSYLNLLDGLDQESTDTGELTPHQIEVIHRTVCQRIREDMDEFSSVHCVPTRYLYLLLDVVDTAMSMMQDAQRWRCVMRNPEIRQQLDNAIRRYLDDVFQNLIQQSSLPTTQRKDNEQ